MTIFQEAHVVVLIADYIGIDAAGKVNAIGAGFVMAGMQPTGLSAPQSVVVLVDIPDKYAGQQFSLALTLRNETTGDPVMLPMPPDGSPQPLRLQQIATVQPAQVPGAYLPPGSVRARVQFPVAFQDGLPLAPGHAYVWQVEIDGQHRAGWMCRFYIPGPPPGLVVGGVQGPADIPNIAPPSTPPVEPPHEKPSSE